MLLKILIHPCRFSFRSGVSALKLLQTFFDDPDTLAYAGVNRFADTTYYNREGFLSFVWWLTFITLIRKTKTGKPKAASPELRRLHTWLDASQRCEYKLDVLFDLLAKGKTVKKKPAVKKTIATKKKATKKGRDKK